MQNLERLLDLYKESSQTEQITRIFSSKLPEKIQLSGLSGAQDAFALSGFFMSSSHHMLIVVNDKENAAYLQNTLDNIFENKRVHFFPDSFKRPIHYEDINSNNILQRTEVVNKLMLSKANSHIIVSYPEALFEKVVAPEFLEQYKIELVKDEVADVDSIMEVVVEYGFERVDFVYEPGQFSIRGGIVDIFSYGNEWPYRIELFDDEIESIRTFNPTTQLSIKNIAKVSIIPNVNSEFKQEQKISFLKTLQEDSIIVFQDYQFFIDQIQNCFESSQKFAKKLILEDESDLKKFFDDRAFLFPNDITDQLDHLNQIHLSAPPFLIKDENKIQYQSTPQPNFNRNFNLLITDLEENDKNGFENYLFTDNTKQIERFYHIFEDLGAKVKLHPISHSIHSGFIDKDLKIACYTDHQIFQRFHKYKLRSGFTKDQAINLKMLRELKPGDFVTHIDHGVGRYSGLEKLDIAGRIQESVRLIYKNNDILYVGINSLHKISKFIGKDGTPPALSKIGGDAWKTLKRKTKKKVKDIAKELIHLYAKRKASKGFAFPADGYLQNELEASFIYEDTPDQITSTTDMKDDMMKSYPMDRLICGDVGFGKTEIALRGAFKAVVAGKQVAVLVPTTILALQHSKTFKDRLEPFGVSVDYINRFRSTKEKNEIFEKLKAGEIDIVIGTHGLLNAKIGFKDLGLLVIDEEQKFGVAAKEKLRNIKVNVDTLTLTATPIPRTLQFSLMAARDLSLLRTPPPNRQPIHTERRVFNEELVRDSIFYEINRGGQVFFVHNRVKSLPDVTAMVKKMCPGVEIAMAHGQMEAKGLEKTLIDFINYKYDVLVCTNIIETGLDIPNANTIIINNAHQFGMSDLHQLRGRVGRSNKKAFCYLFAPPLSVLTPEARKRIKTLEDFSDLGSGFHIAMKDLDIRGAGNLLGGEQSGFISDIGYETYQKILEEAMHELKETEFKELFKEEQKEDHVYVRETEIETDTEMLIPDDYISIIQERLNIYTELDTINSAEDLEKFKTNLEDRFGQIPPQVEELFEALRTRWICKKLGFEKFTLKSGIMRGYFISNAQSSFFESKFFQELMKYISLGGDSHGVHLKQSRNYLILIKEDVDHLHDARIVLQNIIAAVQAQLELESTHE